MTIGIYKITWPSGKYYIGQSLDIERRFTTHLSQCRAGKHYNMYVQQEYDRSAVLPVLEILEETDIDSLNDKEVSYINLSDKLILNILAGGSIGNNKGEHSAIAKYYDRDLLEIFLIIADTPTVNRPSLARHYGIDVSTVRDISAGRGRATLFKEEYPEEYARLLANKASNTRGKNTVKVSNGVDTVTLITGEYSEFCRKHGIQSSNLSKVIHGSRKSTMGWHLVS